MQNKQKKTKFYLYCQVASERENQSNRDNIQELALWTPIKSHQAPSNKDMATYTALKI